MSRVCLFGCATVPLCPVRLPQSRPSALRSCYFLFITKSICSFSGTRCPSMWSGRHKCQWGVLSRLAYICHATVCPSLCSFWGGCSAWVFWWRHTSDTLKRVGKDWQIIGMRQPVKANHGLQRKCKKAKVLSIGQWSKKHARPVADGNFCSKDGKAEWLTTRQQDTMIYQTGNRAKH